MSVLMQKFIFVTVFIIALSSHLNAVQIASATESTEKEITIYAAGDIADCRKLAVADTLAAKTAELISTRLALDKSAAVLTLGDHTYPVGLLSEFNDCYDQTWGKFKERTYPAPGNHEYYTPNAIGYFGYFGVKAGPSQRGYYSVELGKWHVISLNSNLNQDAHKAQLAWLKNDLAQHPAECTLAYWHHPVFSSGGHGNNEIMKGAWKILSDANADVVLVGHDHDYERFAPQDSGGRRDDARGLREFVVGTGGAKLSSFLLNKENSEVRNNDAYGVLKLTLKENSYEWEFLPVAGSNFADRGTGLCH